MVLFSIFRVKLRKVTAAGLILIVALPTLLFPVDGGDANEPDDGVLSSVRIEGLRKTQESVILGLIELEPGDPIGSERARKIEETLVKSDLFASVGVSLEAPETKKEEPVPAGTPSPLDLVITVDEKWTLVPIPFLSSGGDGFNGGLILLESNLLGRNKQLITAGFGGTDGASGFFLFSDPAIFGSRWSGTLSTAVGRSDEETLRPDGERIRAYTTDRQSAGLGIGYRIIEGLRTDARLGVTRWTVTDYSPGLDTEPLDDGSYLEPELRIEYEDTRPVDVLLVGPTAGLAARWVTIDDGWEITANAGWAVPVFTTHRLRVLASGGYGAMPVIAETPISARDGYRTLPYQATNADRWGSTAMLYDLPVVSADWGAFVLSGYWEYGAYDTEILDPRTFTGPGGGFRVYIRQVAIPAVGLDVAYNVIDPAWVFSFTVGARM
ncbi:MAG: hypothetical protein ACLFR8_09685 [Alkalispirochaeta sp.]